MTYRDEVRVSRETIHRIVLRRMGVTFVDVGFYPDRERGTTNGTLSIHGDFGPFEYSWVSTGTPLFSDFLAELNYDYAMGKLMSNRPRRWGAYREDWSTMPGILKREVLRMRREGDISRDQARVMYDYFGGLYPLDGFDPTSTEDLYCQLQESLFTAMVRVERQYKGMDDECGSPWLWLEMSVVDLPEPDRERAEPYFWDEVWPVIVDEIRKLEEELNHE